MIAVGRDPIVSLVAELMHTNEMLNSVELLEEKKTGAITLGKRLAQ